MLCLRCNPLSLLPNRTFHYVNLAKKASTNVVVCATKGPRPRYPRVWKTRKRIGTVSKSAKLVDCVKGLSNVKEEVYGALDSFVAWELEFPLISVKKALKTLEEEQEWKRIIQVAKWMLSKGQGWTMGTYFTLINALAEDGRLDEVEELWTKLFSERLEGMPRRMFDKMITIYYKRDMYDQIFEIFADMEELGVRPSVSVVNMVGYVFQKLDMMDKYNKLKKKYPPPKWEYRHIKGKRVRIQAKHVNKFDAVDNGTSVNGEANHDVNEAGINSVAIECEDGSHDVNKIDQEADTSSNEIDVEANSSLRESHNEDLTEWEHNQPLSISNSS